jgi:HK97 family phage major capsid protein
MFKPFTAAEYRSLDHDAFMARKQEVVDILNSGELPEGITDEQLDAEYDIIMSEIERRNKANKLRSMNLEAVKNGAGTVVAKSEPANVEANESTQERGFQVTKNEDYTQTFEYRSALAKHIMHIEKMPKDVLARAIQTRAPGDPVAVSFADGYTNMTDPTFANTVSTSPVIPFDISDEIVTTRKEYGLLFPLASTSNHPGGYAIPFADFGVQGHWINDKQVSPYQYDTDVDAITFGYHQYEIRFARTLLAEALMKPNYKALIAAEYGNAWGRDMDAAMLNGNGSTQPLGLLKDPRIIDQTPGANTGKALVVEATKEDISDYFWWVKLLFNPAFNRLYRGDGSWVIADSTFGTYIQTLKDDVNRPLVQLNLADASMLPAIRGNQVHTVTTNLLPDFDTAEAGDVFAVFGNLANYTFNYQPGMPITTTSWEDYETNTRKTRLLTALDGKVVDNNGFVILTKKASG